MSQSAGQRSECAISDPRERAAIALLTQTGWTRGELTMAFQISDGALSRILDKEGVGDE